MKHRLIFFCVSIFAFCFFTNVIYCQVSGVPDLEFGSLGEVQITDPINEYDGGSSVLLPDGKLLLAGTTFDPVFVKPTLVLTRLLQNGQVDDSYGVHGQVQPDLKFDLGNGGKISKFALTDDGKVIIAGCFFSEEIRAAFAARLDENGKLDESFGQGGLAIFDVGTYIDKFESLLIKPDGKILLGGFSFGNSSALIELLLVQLNPDGSPDQEFGKSGILVYDPSLNFKSILSLALQEDGKVVTFCRTGLFNDDIEIFRLYPNGTIDSSFATNGNFIFGLPDRNDIPYTGVVQKDQKILFCGTSSQKDTTIGEAILIRLNPNGSFDETFGLNGKVFFNLGLLESASTLVLQPDNKIIVSVIGSIMGTYSHKFRFWTLRCHPDGSLDDNFGFDGLIQTPDYGHPLELVHLLLNDDNKIILTGTIERKLILWRYLNDNFTDIHEKYDVIDLQLKYHPNPVSNHMILEWNQQVPNIVQCDLYNYQGSFIETFIEPTLIQSGSHKELFTFEKDIPQGFYFLVFKSGDETRLIRLIKI